MRSKHDTKEMFTTPRLDFEILGREGISKLIGHSTENPSQAQLPILHYGWVIDEESPCAPETCTIGIDAGANKCTSIPQNAWDQHVTHNVAVPSPLVRPSLPMVVAKHAPSKT